MLWDLLQQHQIRSFQHDVLNTSSNVRQQKNKSYDLVDQINKMVLINQAFWELVRDNTGLTEEDLINKIQEIDLRDGTEDGKITPTTNTCSECDRINSSKRFKCIYCGTDLFKRNVFES